MVFLSYLWSEAKFSDMDKVQKQRGSIVLYKEERNGADYIRIEYVNSQAVALLLAQDTGMEMAGNGSAYIASAAFKLPDFYDRYSPHAYIDYSRVYVRHPKPKREYTLPKGYLELLEQKRYSPSTVKTYRAYFSDFMEYHKGRNIDRLKVPDINKYILYLVNEKKISVSQQNMRINAIKFYYEQVKGGKRQYYGGITRAKEYKSLPEVLSKNEIKRILAQISNIKTVVARSGQGSGAGFSSATSRLSNAVSFGARSEPGARSLEEISMGYDPEGGYRSGFGFGWRIGR